MENGILHVDMNNFYASVETLFAPEFKNVPMAVAGDRESRHGIILAKNMLAKQKGVQTAEPIWQAMRKCPQLQLCQPHHERYAEFSRRAREIYCQYTDRVESFGLDECWLDVYGSGLLFGDGEKIAHEIRERIKKELGLTVSVGVSYNKIFAKLGSDYKKPDAVTVFGRESLEPVIWNMPASAMLYVGATTEKTLKKYGISTIGDLARTSRRSMEQMLGKQGRQLWEYANGLEHSPVELLGGGEPVKTIGNSVTLPRDITHEEEVRLEFLSLAETVARRLRRHGVKAGEVQITVKSGDFEEYQRQCRVDPPAGDSQTLYRTAMALYRRESKKWAIRLLGLRAGKLTDTGQGQLSLFETAENRQRVEKLETTMDSLREKYGKESVARAVTMKRKNGPF